MKLIDGESVHPAVATAYNKLEAAFCAATGEGLIVSSGHRSTATQTAWFLSRYRLQSSGGGPFGDVRWWQGRRYVRHSSAGTVAAPGTSLHESYRAIDIRDTGTDAGVTTAGTPRANWIRSNAHRYGFNPRGYQFREPWHIEFTGSLTTLADNTTTPITTTPQTEEEDEDMKIAHTHWTDNGQTQRMLFTPGTSWYLHWTESGSTIANGLARQLDTGDSVGITASLAAAIKAAADRLK